MKPGPADAQHPAHDRDRVLGLLRRDEPEDPHRVSLSLAKKAAAFFRMSRSSARIRFSRRNRRNSSRSSVVKPSTLAVVDVDLARPVAQRLLRAAQLTRQLRNRPATGPQQADRLSPELLRIRRRLWHRQTSSPAGQIGTAIRCPRKRGNSSRAWRLLLCLYHRQVLTGFATRLLRPGGQQSDGQLSYRPGDPSPRDRAGLGGGHALGVKQLGPAGAGSRRIPAVEAEVDAFVEEADEAGDRGGLRAWCLVAPGEVVDGAAVEVERPVGGFALVWAVRSRRAGLQCDADVCGRQVGADGQDGVLEEQLRAGAFGEQDAVELDPYRA